MKGSDMVRVIKSMPIAILGAIIGGVGGFIVFGILQLLFGWSGETVSFLSKLSAAVIGIYLFINNMQFEKTTNDMEATLQELDAELKEFYGEDYRDLYSGNYQSSEPLYKEEEYIVESPIVRDPKQRIVRESNGDLRIESYLTRQVLGRIRKK